MDRFLKWKKQEGSERMAEKFEQPKSYTTEVDEPSANEKPRNMKHVKRNPRQKYFAQAGEGVVDRAFF